MRTETAFVLFFAGLIFLWALVLGVWKWQAMTNSPNGLAHPYVDIAHRAALLYAFATGLIAVFVELSGWPSAVNFAAAAAMILLFVVTIANYIRLGLRRETDNQMRNPPPSMRFVLAALIVGEIGGFSVLLIGFATAQL
ncbi:hypothetical protein OH799_07640 [Nocardia sp. NBC_00881]|uniref:hypothetical protein n=1 Tax=Nocardia sp. NBC_00881 TaxID=2975995 RepID=UPI0038690EAD|nr:hypothetical protein OH799_07640 [Nocardia sp. NBC_00881]